MLTTGTSKNVSPAAGHGKTYSNTRGTEELLRTSVLHPLDSKFLSTGQY
jgi:hypothetical protein